MLFSGPKNDLIFDSFTQAPRELKKSMYARTLKWPKIDLRIQIFAFCCTFDLQFSKVSVCLGIHGIHRYAAPTAASIRVAASNKENTVCAIQFNSLIVLSHKESRCQNVCFI